MCLFMLRQCIPICQSLTDDDEVRKYVGQHHSADRSHIWEQMNYFVCRLMQAEVPGCNIQRQHKGQEWFSSPSRGTCISIPSSPTHLPMSPAQTSTVVGAFKNCSCSSCWRTITTLAAHTCFAVDLFTAFLVAVIVLTNIVWPVLHLKMQIESNLDQNLVYLVSYLVI